MNDLPDASPPPSTFWEKFRHIIRKLGPVGPVALISATVPAIAGAALLSQLHHLKPWLLDRGLQGIIIFVLGYAICAGFPILPTFSITALGGWVYGFRLGSMLGLAGYMGAVVVSYAWLKRVSQDRVIGILHEHPKWQAVRDGLVGESRWRALFIVALLRVPPNVPFAVINIVLVSAKVRFREYFFGSLIGVIPRTAALAYIASRLGRLEWSKIGEQKWYVAGSIGSTIFSLAVITWLANRAIRHIARGKKGSGI